MIKKLNESKYILRMNGPVGNVSDKMEFDSLKDATEYAKTCDIYNFYWVEDEDGNVVKRGRCNTKRIRESMINENNSRDINDLIKKIKKFGMRCDDLAEYSANAYYILKYDEKALDKLSPEQIDSICEELDRLTKRIEAITIPDDIYDNILYDTMLSPSEIGYGYDFT